MFSKKHNFARVPTSEEDEEAFDHELESKSSPYGRYQSKLHSVFGHGAFLITLFLAAVFGLAFIAFWASPSQSTSSVPPQWSSCGNDPETARSRRCLFDLISFAWQTPECFDGDLVSEFASWEGNWTFFADDKFTQPVEQEIAIMGERTPLFVQWDYHIVHCTFMWRQMHRAYENGWIDEHLGNYNHTLHCQKMMLMDEEAAAKAVTVARVIYPECWRVKVSSERA